MNKNINETKEEQIFMKNMQKFTSKKLMKFLDKHIPMFEDKFVDLIAEAYHEGFSDGLSYDGD